MEKSLKEDLEFARRTDEARKRIEAGEGITMDFDDFIKEMKKKQQHSSDSFLYQENI